jgi:hypothetical protein
MRMSYGNAVGGIRVHEIFVNYGSTLIGTKTFRGWGHLPVHLRDQESVMDPFFGYAFDTLIREIYADGTAYMAPAWLSIATTEHQELLAKALGYDFQVEAAGGAERPKS